MPTDPLTPDVSARICTHMNDDHAEAVLDYARHYGGINACLLYTSPSPRDATLSRMPSSA